MTISVVTTDADEETGTTAATINLAGTEGNFQVVFLTGRTVSNTPTIDGTGWSTPVLIETLIDNTSARRQIAMWWRVVPASAGTGITANWNANTTQTLFGYELTTDTASPTWTKDNHAVTDSGTSGVTSLASGSAAPVNSEAITIYGLVARDAAPATEDSYNNTFVTGPGGAGVYNCSGYSGYKISGVTETTTASWTTSALATGLIATFSVSGAATTPEVQATIPLTLSVGAETAAEHSVTADIPLAIGTEAHSAIQHEVTAAIPLTLAVAPTTEAQHSVTADIPMSLAVQPVTSEPTITPEVQATIPLSIVLDPTTTVQHEVQASIPLSLVLDPVSSVQHDVQADIPLSIAVSANTEDPTAEVIEVTVAVGAARSQTPSVGVARDQTPSVGEGRERLTVGKAIGAVEVGKMRERSQ